VATGHKVYVFDVSTPSAPTLAQTLTMTSVQPNNFAWGASIFDNYLYVSLANTGDGMIIIDITNPGAITQVAYIGVLNWARTPSAIDNNYIIVPGSGNAGLAIVNVTNKAAPAIAYSNGMSGAQSVTGIVVKPVGGTTYAYAISDQGTLTVLNVTTPASTTILTTISDGTGGMKLTHADTILLSGNFLYVTGHQAPFYIEVIDISTPASPVHHSTLTQTAGGANIQQGRASLYGTHLYVNTVNEFDIIDVASLSNPSLTHVGTISTLGLLSGAISLAVSGNYVYIPATGRNILGIIDVSTPSLPVLAGSFIASISRHQWDTCLCGVHWQQPAGGCGYLESGVSGTYWEC
jgi:hypothetical protein